MRLTGQCDGSTIQVMMTEPLQHYKLFCGIEQRLVISEKAGRMHLLDGNSPRDPNCECQ
jgi:hypothetical protein